jgi:hypothetical protein
MTRAKPKSSAIEAYCQSVEEQRMLQQRQAKIRDAAALELGLLVIAAGGHRLRPAELKQAIETAVKSKSPQDQNL